SADGQWELIFALEGWKYVGGALQDRKLTIRKPVSDKELKIAMKQIAPFDILHIQARVAEENSFGFPQGLLVNVIRRNVADVELQWHVARLKEPVVFKDEKLGTFTLDRRYGWFEGDAVWESTDITLHLEPGDSRDPVECLAVAHALWDLQSVWS